MKKLNVLALLTGGVLAAQGSLLLGAVQEEIPAKTAPAAVAEEKGLETEAASNLQGAEGQASQITADKIPRDLEFELATPQPKLAPKPKSEPKAETVLKIKQHPAKQHPVQPAQMQPVDKPQQVDPVQTSGPGAKARLQKQPQPVKPTGAIPAQQTPDKTPSLAKPGKRPGKQRQALTPSRCSDELFDGDDIQPNASTTPIQQQS